MTNQSSNKRQKSSVFEDDLFSEERIAALHREYTTDNAYPFHHISIKNVFDDNLLRSVKQEVLEMRFWPKNNDLYQFLQSKDLRSMVSSRDEIRAAIHGDDRRDDENESDDDDDDENDEDDDDGMTAAFVKPTICKLRDALYSDQFRQFVCKIAGWEADELNSDTVDISAACYRETDHLLCHDDELEGRRIAFIIYLVPEDWSAEDGGALDLFDVDENGQPNKVVKSLVPCWNSMNFFAVTPTSFHQVAEVLRAEEKQADRLSISGWFYGKPVKRPPPYKEPALPFEAPRPISGAVDEKGKAPTGGDDSFIIRGVVREWLNETYCNEETLELVREAFCEQSSVELRDFLREDKYNALKRAVESHKQWEIVGPANRRHYESAQGIDNDGDNNDSIIAQCKRFLGSREFADFLLSITQYEIRKHNIQVRKFSKGCYTLAHNIPFDQHGLDAFLCIIGEEEWDPDHGGSVIYMDESDELLSIEPVGNTFSLVLRDEGVMRFTKYINSRAPSPRYDFCIVYDVPEPEGMPDDDDDDDDIAGDADDVVAE